MDLLPIAIFVLAAMVSSGSTSDENMSSQYVEYGVQNYTTITTTTITTTTIPHKKSAPVCENEICKAVGAQFERSINPNIHPCEDFHSFVCGRWEEMYSIPFDNYEWNQAMELQWTEQDYIGGYLINSKHFTSNYTKNIAEEIRNFFYSCTTHVCNNRIKLQSLHRPLKDMLKKLGGFPLIGFKLDKNYNLARQIALAAAKLDMKDVLFSVDVQKDLLHPKKHILILGNPSVFFKHGYSYFNSTSAYKNEIKKLLKPLIEESEISETQMDKDIDEMIEFERELTEISSVYPPDEIEYSIFSKKRFPNLQVHKESGIKKMYLNYYFNKMFENYTHFDTNTTIINVSSSIELGNLISRYDTNTIANYIGWRIVNEFAEPGGLRNLRHNLANCKRYCSQTTYDYYNLALQFFDLNNYHNSEEGKNILTDIIRALKTAMEIDITDMSIYEIKYKIKSRALIKLVAMNVEPFEPLKHYVAQRLEKIFKIHRNEKNFLKLIFALREDRANEFLLRITETPEMHDSFINMKSNYQPYYDPISNTLVISGSVARFPYFREELPNSVNYGGIGFAVAREMAKAISINLYHHRGGLEIDSRGRLEEILPKEFKDFDDNFSKIRGRSKFIYKTYTEVGDKYNYNQTTYEDMADIIGLKLAYKAYQLHQKRLEDDNVELSLYHLDYNPEQLFYISWANSLCGYHKRDIPRGYYQVQTQSPSEVRIRFASTYGNKDFRRIFHCDEHYISKHRKTQTTVSVGEMNKEKSSSHLQ